MHDTDYAFEDEAYAVTGAALEVLSQLGHGIHEKPYENALVSSSDCARYGADSRRVSM
jgi:hypothetical protein